jgi:hypothetical protein
MRFLPSLLYVIYNAQSDKSARGLCVANLILISSGEHSLIWLAAPLMKWSVNGGVEPGQRAVDQVMGDGDVVALAG